MRKTIVLALVIGLISASVALPAQAAKKKKKRIERVVEFDYQCPCGVRVLGQGLGWQLGSATGENIGGGVVGFDPLSEKYLTAVAKDQSGQNVNVRIAMDLDPDTPTVNDPVGEFCGETKEPIELADTEAEFRVFVHSGTCADGSPALAFGGTITFTFSNLP